ncbi:bifunctional aspartate transaminase/aspartate 4-decarboxylase [Companilactobacillus sp. DQM5]|uniref:bifunctional aspartate transaminase/aspartate 4-decarboxylase n=1 Tax=Companilactobacillus sp. DQM5 TaxID=3463359 RepID=UPI0040585814
MKNLDIDTLKGMSNFEVAALFLENSENNELGLKPINVGRGNPNWINTTARLAYNRIVEFAIQESLKTINEDEGSMAGYIEQTGIADRLREFLSSSKEDKFIGDVLDYTEKTMNLNQDELVFEFSNGAIGNHYPVPSRSLINVEKILNRYLEQSLYNGVKLADQTDVFPTEGGTAAMVYLFNELKISRILQPGDTIAINTPIFTPYLQIPELSEFNLKEFNVSSDESDDWQMIDAKFDELKDPSVKAFFVVNPTNPASRAFSKHALDKIKEVVEANPEIIIITDDVYGTFVNGFQTIYSVAPKNTLLVYSFSKLYGATGQRIGLIATHKDNVFDKIIAKRTAEDESVKKEFTDRYSLVVPNPLDMKFIDRTVADSREIGLYHTAGLSTPQQVMMALFSLTSLIHENDESDPYIEASKKVVDNRYQTFYKSMGIEGNSSIDNAKYYTLVNIYDVVERKYDKDFRDYFESNVHYLEFEGKLASKYGVTVMDGSGMGTEDGYIRISLANQPAENYAETGKRIAQLLEEYHDQYKNK